MKLKMKNSFKIVFIILAILLVTLVVLLINQKEEPKGVNTPLGSYEVDFTEKSINTEKFDDVLNILPIPSIDMRDKIQTLAIGFLKHVHPTREYTEDEVKEYYEVNKITIYEYLNKNSFDDFKALSEKMKEIDESVLKYTRSEFYPETLKHENNEYTVNLQIEYNDKYKIDFIVHLEPEKNNKITFELVK